MLPLSQVRLSVLLFLVALSPGRFVLLLFGSWVSSTSAFLPEYAHLPSSKQMPAASCALECGICLIKDVYRQLPAEERQFLLK